MTYFVKLDVRRFASLTMPAAEFGEVSATQFQNKSAVWCITMRGTMPNHRTKGNHCWSFGVVGVTTTVEHRSNRVSWD